MNLAECVVAASLLTLSSSASMQLMGLAAAGEHRREARALALNAIDSQFRAAEAAMAALPSMPDSACDWVTIALQRRIAAQAVPEGLQRTLTRVDGDRRLLMQLEATDTGRSRRRLLDPAAQGRCGRQPDPVNQPEESDAPSSPRA
ncbi:hypothetical protein EVJ50_14140 [Synechococcus sp. RSCCF101]|uniref:hypothetical protein n=1 Tax=Synechococcus sp. RSCCF101 TaxID=2511069 RepID=UPI00124558C1|nr:hypothetical protein [Synechococcus sp. RSCCF101]QEY33204.1 hypothetical protein EVJ50_14140 [Synechococcus sp. RSCCF101]